jgi:hypothetical protein
LGEDHARIALLEGIQNRRAKPTRSSCAARTSETGGGCIAPQGCGPTTSSSRR